MKRKVKNIQELAEQLHLSPTTVSRVLNGKAETYRISESTSKRVTAAAKRFQYYPNRIARGLKLEKTETIGLIIPDIGNPYFGSIAKTIELAARASGFSIILCDSLDDETTEEEAINLLTGRKADGIIVAPAGNRSGLLVDIYRRGIPVIVIDRYLAGTNLPFVATDNYAGAYRAVEYLIGMGHRNIACIQGKNDISSNSDRVRGYCDALQKHQIEVNPDFITGNDFGEENGFIQTHKLLGQSNKITAILALSNLISLGVLRALKQAGLAVPSDISIVSFDEQAYSAFLACPMTTVEQPCEEIGKSAMESMLKMLRNGNNNSAENYVLPPKLIIRDSVKKQ